MKQFACVLLVFALLLTGCQGRANGGADIEAEADKILQDYNLTTGTRYSPLSKTPGEYLDDELIRSYYGDALDQPDFGSVENYVVYIDETRPTLPTEFGIFKMKDGADTELFMAYLRGRINLKLQNAIAYPTMDVEPLQTAVVEEGNGYIWYVVVKDGNADINNQLKQALCG